MPSTRGSTEAVADRVLRLSDFSVRFATAAGSVPAATEVSLSVAAGECLGVVGESGAGKSQLFLGALGLLAANGRAAGRAQLQGRDLLGLPARELDAVRGRRVGMVFQDPMTSLTPHLRIGTQIAQVRMRHLGEPAAEARRRALELLRRVHVNDPEQRLLQYPHELSGGMRQRAMIAIALAGNPQLLIADEPTTALDVTVQAQILALLQELKRETGLALILISHDLGAVAGLADTVAVMRQGRLIECAPATELFASPRQAYTRALLEEARALAAPVPAQASGEAPVALEARALSVSYPVPAGGWGRRAALAALSEASLTLHAGESLGVVGESGSGKSTLARALLKLVPHTAGRVVWMGRDLDALSRARLRAQRRDLQIIFQDPLGSLDPRMRVAELVGEGLRVHEPSLSAAARRAAAQAMLARVGLEAGLMERYPHELSGGQGQRVGIARAMVLAPKLLVCDEPVSSLDVHSQAQVVELIAALKRETGLALLFVSHNLGIVQRLCERVLVLYLGRMMELAPAGALFAAPRHPYTRELLAAIPLPDPRLQPGRLSAVRAGEAPSPRDPPSGCVYRTRCPFAQAACAAARPAWEAASGQGAVACRRWREI
ncbi:MAG: dipeptide ABC transporter ATP-binding protein [Proteobacteria bacterium]|nr:dipeptide ABC transporter ATP-binding protein [Pseudomonadota bacterium]